ncbi:MAG: hypothetical protein AABZ31_01510 [Bdellovibrionota bacterium]
MKLNFSYSFLFMCIFFSSSIAFGAATNKGATFTCQTLPGSNPSFWFKLTVVNPEAGERRSDYSLEGHIIQDGKELQKFDPNVVFDGPRAGVDPLGAGIFLSEADPYITYFDASLKNEAGVYSMKNGGWIDFYSTAGDFRGFDCVFQNGNIPN